MRTPSTTLGAVLQTRGEVSSGERRLRTAVTDCPMREAWACHDAPAMPHFWIVVQGSDPGGAPTDATQAAGARSGPWDGEEPAIGDVIDFGGSRVQIDDKKAFAPPPRQDEKKPYKKKLFGHDA